MRGQRSLPAVAPLIAGISATGFLAPRPAEAGVPIGRRIEVTRRACRQKDGTWHIID